MRYVILASLFLLALIPGTPRAEGLDDRISREAEERLGVSDEGLHFAAGATLSYSFYLVSPDVYGDGYYRVLPSLGACAGTVLAKEAWDETEAGWNGWWSGSGANAYDINNGLAGCMAGVVVADVFARSLGIAVHVEPSVEIDKTGEVEGGRLVFRMEF